MTAIGWALVFIGFLAALVVADLSIGVFLKVRAWHRRRRALRVWRAWP